MNLYMIMHTPQGKACNRNARQSASQNPRAKVPWKNSQALGGEAALNAYGRKIFSWNCFVVVLFCFYTNTEVNTAHNKWTDCGTSPLQYQRNKKKKKKQTWAGAVSIKRQISPVQTRNSSLSEVSSSLTKMSPKAYLHGWVCPDLRLQVSVPHQQPP